MAAHGYDFAHPIEPIQAPAAGTSYDDPGRRPSEEEVAMATADVECKRTTGLLDTATSLRDAHSRLAVEGAPDILAEYRQINDRALANAVAYEAGTLPGPWRTTPSAEAPHNTAACTWLSDERQIDLSAGESVEFDAYLGAVRGALAQGAPGDVGHPSARDLVPPPWLLNAGSCVAEATAEDVPSP